MSSKDKHSHDIHYKVLVEDAHAHLWRVFVFIKHPNHRQKFQLPVWIPGSYLIREYSKQLSSIEANQDGVAVSIKQIDKCTWLTQNKRHSPLQLQYLVHAHDISVRTAWLDANRGFFNGTSMFLQVVGKSEVATSLELLAPLHDDTWQVATALSPVRVNRAGFGTYQAKNYDELVDSPFELSNFSHSEFAVRQTTHHIAVSGATPSFDAQRLRQDVERICNCIVRFWHGSGSAPFSNYVFLLNAVNDGYGGLEHKNSTALLCRRKDLPKLRDKHLSDDYLGLLGLFSHEYFHAWNVKRLRPSNYANYNYQSEQYTDMLWFFEGFTDYYDNLMLCRSELISPAQYLKLLTKSIQQYIQTPGRRSQSVAAASLEAWTKYYRPDSNTPNITVSYYTKGSLIALCLDLLLRQMGFSLDHVMRELWQQSQGGPISEDDVLQALFVVSGKSWRKKLHTWVHTVEELPLAEVLQEQGIAISYEPSPLAQQLGLRVKEDHSVHIQYVHRGSAAELAGFSAGDEWLGIESGRGQKLQSWRLQRLEQLPLFLGNVNHCIALIARDGHLLRLKLAIPLTDPTPVWRLNIEDPIKVGHWLSDRNNR